MRPYSSRARPIDSTRPTGTPLILTGAPTSRPCTDSVKYVSTIITVSNHFPAPNTTTPATASAVAPITNRPILK